MFKQLVVGGALIAGFTGLGLDVPAYADGGPWPPGVNNGNNAMQSHNVNVCGNHGIGDIGLNLLNVGAITTTHTEPVSCNFSITQN
ncbi:hypothetical protein AB0B45_47020 [Nonomuraea sp. NPDC049152]|uniref:hypothetical protein n=1 Tax=Nonomuraea sp. NPDC049152 TaxID=3154350 RepID=UPI00340D0BEA